MAHLNLTPFGFTPTESLVYEVLLTGGPGTGYAIARYRSSVSKCVIDHNRIVGQATMMADSSGCALDANQLGADPRGL